jgi:hypothetical protein
MKIVTTAIAWNAARRNVIVDAVITVMKERAITHLPK